MTRGAERGRRRIPDAEVMSRANQLELRKKTALDVFLGEITRLGNDQKLIGPNVFGFESFYRHNGNLVQVLRRVPTADTPVCYYQDWGEVSFRVPLPTESNRARIQYFLETSYFHNAFTGTADVEKMYRLYRGDRRGHEFITARQKDEGATPKFFEEPGIYVERAISMPRSPSVLEAIESRGLTVLEGVGLVDLLFKGKEAADDDYPVKLVSPAELERITKQLGMIDEGADKVKLPLIGEA